MERSLIIYEKIISTLLKTFNFPFYTCSVSKSCPICFELSTVLPQVYSLSLEKAEVSLTHNETSFRNNFSARHNSALVRRHIFSPTLNWIHI